MRWALRALEDLREIHAMEMPPGGQAQRLLERAEEAVDDPDGAMFADSAETLPDAMRGEVLAEDFGSELRALVADEVARPSVSPECSLGQPYGLRRTGFAIEHADCERESGVDIEDGLDCELLQAE